MKPLIKWPGGKTREFKYISSLIPKYTKYIEPFFGGGAIYFKLEPGNAFINDISSDLIRFYNFIKHNDVDLKKALNDYADNWSAVSVYLDNIYNDVYKFYNIYRLSINNPLLVTLEVGKVIENSTRIIEQTFDLEFLINIEDFKIELKRNLGNKLKRMRKLELKKGALSKSDVKDNIEAALRGSFYMHFRNIYNDILLNKSSAVNLSTQEKTANYYFIREFCYGSMFRYNLRGEFNIPYGGISYNKKDFNKKVEQLFSKQVIEQFSQTTLYQLDFEKFLNQIDLDENSFVFLDPPYDTNFSDYEGRTFDRQDQIRLAKFLYNTASKFILIIKNTDFIFKLYNNKQGIRILSFDRKYSYNVRSRNDRDVKHLIITNIML